MLYDIRGPIMDAARRMEEEGHKIIKLNIGNLAVFGFDAPEEIQQDPEAPKISKYAYGEDYHFVIKDKLKSFLKYLQDEIGQISGRVFVDSAPVMEKAWAKRAGAGWIGKHTNLIHPKMGSFFFLSEMIISPEEGEIFSTS